MTGKVEQHLPGPVTGVAGIELIGLHRRFERDEAANLYLITGRARAWR